MCVYLDIYICPDDGTCICSVFGLVLRGASVAVPCRRVAAVGGEGYVDRYRVST